MLKRTLAFAAAFIVTATTAQFAQTGQQTAPRYLTPPKEIVEAFDAPLLPQAILSPSKQVIALAYRRNYPTIAELSQPILRLGVSRWEPGCARPRKI